MKTYEYGEAFDGGCSFIIHEIKNYNKKHPSWTIKHRAIDSLIKHLEKPKKRKPNER